MSLISAARHTRVTSSPDARPARLNRDDGIFEGYVAKRVQPIHNHPDARLDGHGIGQANEDYPSVRRRLPTDIAESYVGGDDDLAMFVSVSVDCRVRMSVRTGLVHVLSIVASRFEPIGKALGQVLIDEEAPNAGCPVLRHAVGTT